MERFVMTSVSSGTIPSSSDLSEAALVSDTAAQFGCAFEGNERISGTSSPLRADHSSYTRWGRRGGLARQVNEEPCIQLKALRRCLGSRSRWFHSFAMDLETEAPRREVTCLRWCGGRGR
ncbi:hypothetical protein Y1Q_0023699 [Alligator mississippiensis]|uniref:Uncharacterized protein n=1 Tax=Alligator mississippiensis TaxID=8496 RepID=A0A151NBR2_ALLMI|nr:hypothetical protein Y1Q_0023699 [Alligator mississippiensis]